MKEKDAETVYYQLDEAENFVRVGDNVGADCYYADGSSTEDEDDNDGEDAPQAPQVARWR